MGRENEKLFPGKSGESQEIWTIKFCVHPDWVHSFIINLILKKRVIPMMKEKLKTKLGRDWEVLETRREWPRLCQCKTTVGHTFQRRGYSPISRSPKVDVSNRIVTRTSVCWTNAFDEVLQESQGVSESSRNLSTSNWRIHATVGSYRLALAAYANSDTPQFTTQSSCGFNTKSQY